MSSFLWKAYYEDDVFAFQQLLQNAGGHRYTKGGRGGGGGATGSAAVIGSPVSGFLGSSPGVSTKGRRHAAGLVLTKADVNARDTTGQTLLHHAASSTSATALAFATALTEHLFTDVYLQDYENGWTALHRAFYFGNITIARLILERGSGDMFGKLSGPLHPTSALIKVKDKEGLGPLDLFTSTIKDRTLRPQSFGRQRSGSSGSDEDRAGPETDEHDTKARIPFVDVGCDQLFTFGSNQNVSLGFGDEDDRQFPERVTIRRPEHLLRGFYVEHLKQRHQKWAAHDPYYRAEKVDVTDLWIEDIPYLPKSKQLRVQDVVMSKLHTAVLTSDAEANLYMCGHGKGGRLGTGDERTRFNLTCIETGGLAGKRVAAIALGLNHSLALCEAGEIFSWGNNGFGQLGYSLPKSATSEEDPISTIPRQIFGPLKRETVYGIAASRIHSVAFSGSSLFTFGKNEGQLGIMDSDARSLEAQVTPRKVAASLFSSNISAVSAMDKATVCLLENHEVWVFANFGYAKVPFPLEGFSNYFLKESFLTTNYDHETNRIVKLTCGGDTICALSSRGDIFALSISQRQDKEASTSTTNPAKIKSAITKPLRIWSPKKNSMAARDVGVDADGSIILSTDEGSVWKRTRRVTIKDASALGVGEYKPDSFKFSRIPGLTRVLAIRASAHGAYAALRSDCDVTKTQIVVEDPSLRQDLWPLLALRKPMEKYNADEHDDENRHRFWQGPRKVDELAHLKRAILRSKDIEGDLVDLEQSSFADPAARFDALIATTASDVRIPVHRFVLTGRSRVLRRGFRDLCATSTFTIPEMAVSELNEDGIAVLKFQGLDILTVIDLVIYLYTDSFIDFWHLTRDAPKMAFRYRQVRTELMKVATKLELNKLEPAARQMVQPRACLDMDFEVAYQDPAFFYDGDIVVQLEDDEVRVHSALVRARCPFFEGLFMGRAGGRWVAGRDEDEDVNVDLSHINSKTFTMVLRHIYADTGSELFDEIVSVGMDDFLDAVMDVMSAANELMLERLSQICQEVIGRFVSVRNVCGLLNAISPSSVREFKDTALEYLCSSLESMLQGHYLNELDEDLLEELDAVVRENQLAYMPFARSGRAERALLERNPELAEIVERNRQSRVDAVALRAKHHGLDNLKVGSLGDETLPLQQKARRRSSFQQKSDRPSLKGKASSKDMVFDMDDEFDPTSPSQSPSIRPMSGKAPLDPIASSVLEDEPYGLQQKNASSSHLLPKPTTPGSVTPRTPRSPYLGGATPPSAGQPWSLTPLPGAKTDMKDIMAQAAGSRTSSLSQGLAASKSSGSPSTLPAQKISQKERKRLQQQSQLDSGTVPPAKPSLEPSSSKSTSAWQTGPGQRSSSIKDILGEEKPTSPKPSASRASSTPQLTMRQTVANPKPPVIPPQKPVIGPAGQSAVQQRVVSESSSKPTPPTSPEQNPSRQQRQILPQSLSSGNSKPIPQSIRHQPPPIENILGLSMSEIVAQQQLEKDIVRDAVQKRDLSEIQAEQEFQEWWDKEAARVQEAEQRDAAAATRAAGKRHRGRRSRPAKSGEKEKIKAGGGDGGEAGGGNAR